ncbi:hypothetical protein EV384_3016 [Micromonospora kangleipakensis]|uniref:Uncharacterized protein n=1 Tax=Micromonospora kangleipakensis TaxID=1077942 RepID=A0A4Q8B9V3_9ACTN|nr:hypothetical protein [Micromonospora kangleipakensis]RZU74544.1 hypothetical protein EV384_3016 [Micromonospora kangleipakensis]
MTTVQEHEERSAEVAVDRQPRVLLLSFNMRPHDRVVALAERLLDEGARVDLLVLSDKNWADFADRPGLRVLALNGAEKRHPVLRVERILVTRAPEKVLNGLGRLTGDGAAGRPVRVLSRGHTRVSRAFHRRVFMKTYANFRPLVLSRIFDKRLPAFGLDNVDMIVASDALSVTLGWKLARRFPHAIATTSLDPPPVAELASRP